MTRWWLAPCALVCASCLSDGGAGDEDVAVGPPPGITVSGGYALVSPMDLTVGAVLPAPIADYVDVLRQLRDDPGNAFFDLLEDAGVPLVSELRAVLPDSLESKVGGWISDAITAPFRDEIDLVLDLADTALARFELVSELDLPAPDRAGRCLATHTLRAVRFRVDGRDVDIASPVGLASRADATIGRGSGGADASLTLGSHAFGLAYGDLAYQLLERVAEERYGTTLRGALGELADCPGVAAEVAAKCILSVCVGHKAELEALCEKGLDKAIEKLREELGGLRFDAVSFAGGTAAMYDVRADGGGEDGALDRIAGGVWTASLNLGQGPRSVPATFTGARN